ncbi:MAG: hypothetical protein JWN04_4951 [Myxococcaceae bacterium]|nr:hypothetical protein [Myxococcaceae bacterium]
MLQSDHTLVRAEHGLALFYYDRAATVVFAADPPGAVVWLEDSDGSWAPGPQIALDSRAVHASAVCSAAHCELAWVDERARLLARSLGPAGLDPTRVLASGVDRRFAPALAEFANGIHYAYTASVEDAMHTLWVTRVGDKVSVPRDLTPPGHGAAASTFVLGATVPTLVFIDAHAGISPLLELRFDPAGRPGEVVVRTPVSQPFAPPLLSAVQWSDGRAEVVFSAVGRMAMTAIARVSLRTAIDPVALQPSTGYGALSFSAARAAHRALFALEVPSASAPDAPRSLALKLLDGVRTDDGPRLELGAHRPSLASGPHAGDYLLSYVRDEMVHVLHVACAD